MKFNKNWLYKKFKIFGTFYMKMDSRISKAGFFSKITMVILLYMREMLFFHNYRIGFFKIQNIKTYCANNDYVYRLVETSMEREICKPDIFEIEKEKIEKANSPEIYIAELRNITVTGGNSFLLSGKYCMYDLINEDKEGRFDLSFESLLYISKKRAIVALYNSLRQRNVIEEGIFLIGAASYNYYHFTVEILSRLAYVDQYEVYRKLPIIVDCIIKEVPQYRELLERFNVFKHTIIYINTRENILVKKLIYPSPCTWMPINICKHGMMMQQDFALAKSGIWNIRNRMQKDSEKNSIGYKKIFISRRNNINKRLVNEEDIVNLFKKYDFEIVYPEEMSMQEQLDMFSHTAYFACTTGAALTNIIYSASNTHVICIIPERFGFYLYSTIAHLLGIKCTFLDAIVTNSSITLSQDSFKLDETYCERFLKTIDQ